MKQSPMIRLALAATFASALAGGAFAQAPAQAPRILTELAPARSGTLPGRAVSDGARQGRFNPVMLDASEVVLPLPDGRELVAARKQEFRGNRGERTWVGEFAGEPGSLLSITVHRGMVNGFIHYGTEVWEIESDGPGRSNLYRVDTERLPPEGTPLPRFGDMADKSGVALLGDGAMATATAPVTQDLLVVYTQGAIDKYGGEAKLQSMILNAVAAANSAYTNSLVGIHLNLVSMERIDYTETGDMGTSLSRLRVTNDGYMDGVHARRDALGADLVALLTNEGNYCGIAYLTGATGSPSSGFSVTAPSCFSGQTFAHEIGHNQGNHHDRANGGSTPAFPYSYGYRTCDNIANTAGQNFRTVMAYSCSSTPRVNWFSNPNVFYNGAQMGVDYTADPANSADNARSMNQTAPYIAAYRAAPSSTVPQAPVSLAGSATAYNRIDISWTDNSSDETGFVVQRATGGGGYTDRATLGANVTSFADTGLSANTSYAYRVRAYNSAGASEYSNVVSVITPAAPPPPTAPDSVTVTTGPSLATVSWTNVENETGYEVVRETKNTKRNTWGSANTTRVGADQTSLTQSLSAGTYRYRVRATGISGNSAYTVSKEFTVTRR
jgi:peptidyl-Asp metalloendopeptidase